MNVMTLCDNRREPLSLNVPGLGLSDYNTGDCRRDFRRDSWLGDSTSRQLNEIQYQYSSKELDILRHIGFTAR